MVTLYSVVRKIKLLKIKFRCFSLMSATLPHTAFLSLSVAGMNPGQDRFYRSEIPLRFIFQLHGKQKDCDFFFP